MDHMKSGDGPRDEADDTRRYIAESTGSPWFLWLLP